MAALSVHFKRAHANQHFMSDYDESCSGVAAKRVDVHDGQTLLEVIEPLEDRRPPGRRLEQ
jgi:hypothetical protein